MVHTWVAEIEPLFEEMCYRRYYLEAPHFRQEKADRIRKIEGKAQSIGVWSLYAMMKQYYGFGEDAVYNFSHSGKYVLCSVNVDPHVCGEGDSLPRLGCDLEKVQKPRLRMAEKYFCESEYRAICEEQDEKSQAQRFFRYWVLKESFVKAIRTGLTMSLKAFEIRLGEPSVLVRQPEEYPEHFYYMEAELEHGAYRVAVCSTDSEMDPKIRIVQLGL